MTDDDDRRKRYQVDDDGKTGRSWTRGREQRPVAAGEVPIIAQAMAVATEALIRFCEAEKIKLHDVVLGIRVDTIEGDDEPNALCGYIDGHEARGMKPIEAEPTPVLDALLFHLRETGAAEGVGIGVANAADLLGGGRN